MTMDDLISRSAAIEYLAMNFGLHFPFYDGTRLGTNQLLVTREDVISAIKHNIPTIDAEPVRHAENVTPTHPSDMFICGGCGFVCEITKLIYKDEDHPEVGPPEAFEYECEYCPHCGSKMDAKEA